MSSNSTPQVGGGGGIKSPNGIVNGGPPNLGGLFSQGMPKLRSTGKFITARDEAEDSVSKSIAAQSARETSSLSGTPKRTANSASSGTPINKSPINSNTNSTIKASLEAQFQLQNGIHRNGSGNNSSSLNNNNINNKNYNTKFNTISTTRSQQSQWKVSPTANSSDLPNQQTHSPVNSYSKGPAPSVPSNMATDSSPISAQVTSNNNRPGTVNRSKSVGKPSQRPAHPAVRPPPPPKTTGINAVTLQSNTTSIPVNLSQSSINSFVSRRTSLDPSSVAEEGSTTVAPVSNKPPPPPRNLPVTHGPPPPLAPHGRATGNTGLASGLSKSQSSINGPSRPSAPPPPPPPHSRTPSTVSVSSSNLSNILKPSYPAPPPPAPLGQNSSNRTLGTLGQTNGASGTTSNPSRGRLLRFNKTPLPFSRAHSLK